MVATWPQQLLVSVLRAWIQKGKESLTDWFLFPGLHDPRPMQGYMYYSPPNSFPLPSTRQLPNDYNSSYQRQHLNDAGLATSLALEMRIMTM